MSLKMLGLEADYSGIYGEFISGMDSTVSLKDIENVLNAHGVETETLYVLKNDLHYYPGRIFIVYRFSHESSLGHFFVLRVLDGGMAQIIDAPKNPMLLEIKNLSSDKFAAIALGDGFTARRHIGAVGTISALAVLAGAILLGYSIARKRK